MNKLLGKIRAIEKTFEAVAIQAQSLVHPTNKSLKVNNNQLYY